MIKARFYIKDKVQEVGYRVHISPYRACGVVGQSPTMQKILNSGLNGAALNLADGRVEVRLEGDKERIEEFYEELKEEKMSELVAEKPEFYNLEFKVDLMVPDSMRSSQALILEQLSTGIVYIAGMNENIKGMNENIKGMNENIKGMSGGIRGMEEKLDKLPERIVKELKTFFLKKEKEPEPLPGKGDKNGKE
ncbi:MAG: acylphosphatase [archaeon]|nr:acylphosphatase [archaeon]